MFDEMQQPQMKGLEEYWSIIRRRRWMIMLTTFLCWAAIWGVGWLLPATYQSEALILVEQQKVPEQYVVPNVSVSLQDRLNTLTQEILSRTQLQKIIDQFHLYPHHNGRLAFFESDDPVDSMNKDIKIDVVAVQGHPDQLSGFKIYYTASTPELAQQVNRELTRLFVDENTDNQTRNSQITTNFLTEELEQAKASLNQQENKVSAFKAAHMGDLPSQMQSNVQILAGLQNQLQGAQMALDRAQQTKLYLESMVQQYQSAEKSEANADSTGVAPPTLDDELKQMRLQLAAMRAQYTDSYPDVIALKDQIAKTEKLKSQIEKEAAANEKSTKSGSGTDAAAALQNGTPTPLMQIQSQLKANQLEIQGLLQGIKELQGKIVDYQARLNLTPDVEQQLAEISRGYDEAQKNYDSLLQKQQQSQLATNLQLNAQGEQFQTMDPASLPDKPSSPNHFLISLGGLAFGLALASGFVALFEITDARIRQEKDLAGLVSARVLVGIPRLTTSREARRHAVMVWVGRATATAMTLILVVGSIYSFFKG